MTSSSVMITKGTTAQVTIPFEAGTVMIPSMGTVIFGGAGLQEPETMSSTVETATTR